MKLARMLLTGSLLLVLAGCGNDSPVTEPPVDNPGTDTPDTPGGIPGFPGGGVPTTPGTSNDISGTVTAPGGDVSDSVVVACPGNAATATCSDSETQTVIVDASGAYSFAELSATEYILFAFKDNTGSDVFANGDYFGLYTTDGTNPAPVTPPAENINITMTVYDDGTELIPIRLPKLQEQAVAASPVRFCHQAL